MINKEDFTLLYFKRDRKGCFSWQEVPVKKAPSYRHFMTAWEYAEKMWIFGGCGPSPADVGHLNDFVDFYIECCYDGANHSVNNRFLFFDPICSELGKFEMFWSSAFISMHQLNSGVEELYYLNMYKLSWTQIQCKQSIPNLYGATLTNGFTGICSNLILYGIGECESSPNTHTKITWIFHCCCGET